MSFVELPPLLIQPGVIITGLLIIAAGVLLTMRRLLWMNEALPTDLFMAECEVKTRKPVPLIGTPDEVYKALRGELIPVDTKIRKKARLYESDRTQLSVYRTILRHSSARELGMRWRRKVPATATFASRHRMESSGSGSNPIPMRR